MKINTNSHLGVPQKVVIAAVAARFLPVVFSLALRKMFSIHQMIHQVKILLTTLDPFKI
jgi:hypothetical protein